jgi:hypothetical protein
METKTDAERQIMQGNGQGLLEFIDRCGERGDLNSNTAGALKATAKAVLAVESTEPADIDVRSLDADDLLRRFATLRKADYSEGSIETYRSRFRKAIAMYIGWLDDDPHWKTAGQPQVVQSPRRVGQMYDLRPNRSRRKPTPKASSVAERESVESVSATLNSDDSSPDASVRLMTYDFALRPDLIVRVTLPVDLTTEDADRFANFVRVLAFSPQPPRHGGQ